MRLSFDAILETLREPDDAQEAAAVAAPYAVAPVVAVPLAGDAPPAPGESHLFEHAFAWVPEPDAPQPPPPAPPPVRAVEDLETIARELDLAPNASAEELHRARRRFMWENHPDRRPDLDPESASRRVGIANMLIDRALRRSAGREDPGQG